MRIAIVTETFLPKWDGIANTLCHLLDHLETRGHTTQLFAPDGVVSSYGRTPVVHFPSIPFPLYPSLRLSPPFVGIREPLRKFQPDVLHVLGPTSLGIEAVRAGSELRIPTVASFHTDLPGFAKQWGLGIMSNWLWSVLRDVHNQAAMTLAPSEYTKRQLVSLGFERVGIWSRGVDTKRFSQAHRSESMRSHLSAGEIHKPLLLFVGRISPEKRIDLLKPALAANPHCRLAVVGDGPQLNHLKRLFAGTPTVFTGALRNEELAQAYASADIFAYTGAHETFGNVILEAMASGLAIIAPQAGGLLDFSFHGENALLFSPANQSQLSAHIHALSSDVHLATEIAACGLETARSMTWEKTLDGLIAQYESLLGTPAESLGLPVQLPQSITVE